MAQKRTERSIILILAIIVGCEAFLIFVMLRGHDHHIGKNAGTTRAGSVELSTMKVDFGSVLRGARPVRKIMLTNHGRRPLVIRSIRLACACGTGWPSTKRVAPNQSTLINLKLSSSSLFGAITKTGYVVFENPDVEPIRFKLTANILPPNVFFKPAEIRFGDISLGDPVVDTVEVNSQALQVVGFTINGIRGSSPKIRTEYSAEQQQSLVKFEADTCQGRFRESVQVDLRGRYETMSIAIPVKGRVIGVAEVYPRRLFLGVVDPGQRVDVELEVYAVDNSLSFAILQAEDLKNPVVDILQGNKFVARVGVRIPDSFGFFEGKISLRTNAKRQPLIEVPYAGLAGL